MSFPAPLTAKAMELIAICRAHHLKLASAESCTGGLVAAVITSIAGASDVYESGFVTYSNHAKTEFLGVHGSLITDYGAVSEDVARTMAEGAIKVTKADIALAVTGIDGPGCCSEEKPVGLVYIAAVRRGLPMLHKKLLLGDLGREEIRLRSVAEVLTLGLAQAGVGAP